MSYGSCSCWPTLQPQQYRIQTMYETYTTADGNAGSFNALSKARDWTHILMDTSWVYYCCATIGTSHFTLILKFINSHCSWLALGISLHLDIWHNSKVFLERIYVVPNLYSFAWDEKRWSLADNGFKFSALLPEKVEPSPTFSGLGLASWLIRIWPKLHLFHHAR